MKKKGSVTQVSEVVLWVAVIFIAGLFLVSTGSKIFDALDRQVFPSLLGSGCSEKAEISVDALAMAIECSALMHGNKIDEFNSHGCGAEIRGFGDVYVTCDVENFGDLTVDSGCHVHNFKLPQTIDTGGDRNLIEKAIDYINGYGNPECLVYYERFPEEEAEYWRMEPQAWELSAIAISGAFGLVGGVLPAAGTMVKKGAKTVAPGTVKLIGKVGRYAEKGLVEFQQKFLGKMIRKATVTTIKVAGGELTSVEYHAAYNHIGTGVFKKIGLAKRLTGRYSDKISDAVGDVTEGLLKRASGDGYKKLTETQIKNNMEDTLAKKLVKDDALFTKFVNDNNLVIDKIQLETQLNKMKVCGIKCSSVDVKPEVRDAVIKKTKKVYFEVTPEMAKGLTSEIKNTFGAFADYKRVVGGAESSDFFEKLAYSTDMIKVLKKGEPDSPIKFKDLEKIILDGYKKSNAMRDSGLAESIARKGMIIGRAAWHTSSGKILVMETGGDVWDSVLKHEPEWKDLVEDCGTETECKEKADDLVNTLKELAPEGSSVSAWGKCSIMTTGSGKIACLGWVSIGIGAEYIDDMMMTNSPVGINAIATKTPFNQPRIRVLHPEVNKYYVSLNREVSPDTRFFSASPCYAKDIRITKIATSCIPRECTASGQDEPKYSIDEEGRIYVYDDTSGEIIARSVKKDISFMETIFMAGKDTFKAVADPTKEAVIDWCNFEQESIDKLKADGKCGLSCPADCDALNGDDKTNCIACKAARNPCEDFDDSCNGPLNDPAWEPDDTDLKKAGAFIGRFLITNPVNLPLLYTYEYIKTRVDDINIFDTNIIDRDFKYHEWELLDENGKVTGKVTAKLDIDNRRLLTPEVAGSFGLDLGSHPTLATICGGATIEKDWFNSDDVFYTSFPIAYTVGVTDEDFDPDKEIPEGTNKIEVTKDYNHYVKTKDMGSFEKIGGLAFPNQQADHAYEDFKGVKKDTAGRPRIPPMIATADSSATKICIAPKTLEDGGLLGMFNPFKDEIKYTTMTLSIEYWTEDGWLNSADIEPPDGSGDYSPNYCYSESNMYGQLSKYVWMGTVTAVEIVLSTAAAAPTGGAGLVLISVAGGVASEVGIQMIDRAFDAKWPFHNKKTLEVFVDVAKKTSPAYQTYCLLYKPEADYDGGCIFE